MANSWSPAPEVAEVARKLIRKYPDELKHLVNIPTFYVFCEEKEKVSGKECWGTARKIPAREGYWIQMFVLNVECDHCTGNAIDIVSVGGFLVTIHGGTWAMLKQLQRDALVHHELLHCGVEIGDDGNEKLSMVPHDIEEFRSIVARYGYWQDGIEEFARAAQAGQASLFDQRVHEVAGDLDFPGDLKLRIGDGPEVSGQAAKEALVEHVGGLVEKLVAGDGLIDDALAVVAKHGSVSTSLLQRNLNIGFQKAKALIDLMELSKVVGPADGPSPRKLLIGNQGEAKFAMYAALEQGVRPEGA